MVLGECEEAVATTDDAIMPVSVDTAITSPMVLGECEEVASIEVEQPMDIFDTSNNTDGSFITCVSVANGTPSVDTDITAASITSASPADVACNELVSTSNTISISSGFYKIAKYA